MRWAIVLALISTACGPTAEASYTAAHMKCVYDNSTRLEIDACRAHVRELWGTDGGR